MAAAPALILLNHLDPPHLEKAIAFVSGNNFPQHRALIAERRASLYMVPDRGFILLAKQDAVLLVLAIRGRNLVTRSVVTLMQRLARLEGCSGICGEVTNPRLRRVYSRLGAQATADNWMKEAA